MKIGIEFHQNQLLEALDWAKTERVAQSIGLYPLHQHFFGWL